MGMGSLSIDVEAAAGWSFRVPPHDPPVDEVGVGGAEDDMEEGGQEPLLFDFDGLVDGDEMDADGAPTEGGAFRKATIDEKRDDLLAHFSEVRRVCPHPLQPVKTWVR